jgi:hypothetical protein
MSIRRSPVLLPTETIPVGLHEEYEQVVTGASVAAILLHDKKKVLERARRYTETDVALLEMLGGIMLHFKTSCGHVYESNDFTWKKVHSLTKIDSRNMWPLATKNSIEEEVKKINEMIAKDDIAGKIIRAFNDLNIMTKLNHNSENKDTDDFNKYINMKLNDVCKKYFDISEMIEKAEKDNPLHPQGYWKDHRAAHKAARGPMQANQPQSAQGHAHRKSPNVDGQKNKFSGRVRAPRQTPSY